MPCNGYHGLMTGVNNPWAVMNSDYCDDAQPSNSMDYTLIKQRHEKIKMLKKYEENNIEEWEKHFNKYIELSINFEIPRPVMIGCNPYFSGGLYIDDDKLYFEENKEVVSDFDCLHYKFDAKLLRSPTNKEYFKYFSNHYENFKYRIKFFEPENYVAGKSKNGVSFQLPKCVVVLNKKKRKNIK